MSSNINLNELADAVHEKMLFDGFGSNITVAIDTVLRSHFGSQDNCPEGLKEDLTTKVHRNLPDEFRYEHTYHPDYGPGLEIIAGCPQCGNAAVFNVEYAPGTAQFVSYNKTDDGHEECFIDDDHTDIETIACAVCGTVLEDTADD